MSLRRALAPIVMGALLVGACGADRDSDGERAEEVTETNDDENDQDRHRFKKCIDIDFHEWRLRLHGRPRLGGIIQQTRTWISD